MVHETEVKTIHYLYDFGDSWNHVIKLEKWLDDMPTDGLPRCHRPLPSGGWRAGPAMPTTLRPLARDPTHPEGKNMRLPSGSIRTSSIGGARRRRQRILGKVDASPPKLRSK
ncbi:IS1096 element passenger TnpR family protein [Bradyrhizobium sp. ORS 86]|uniref:IS1096 element passenger TnpR family protein n=1 Tax=Bradyrhizobium sp. ORS 86 TaxID=1685970 RepID=UPI00388EB1DA